MWKINKDFSDKRSFSVDKFYVRIYSLNTLAYFWAIFMHSEVEK